jgi:hypothetical protein
MLATRKRELISLTPNPEGFLYSRFPFGFPLSCKTAGESWLLASSQREHSQLTLWKNTHFKDLILNRIGDGIAYQQKLGLCASSIFSGMFPAGKPAT